MGTIKSKHKRKKKTPNAKTHTEYCDKCNVFYLKFDDNHCCNIHGRDSTPKETKKNNESSRKPSDNTISFPVRKLSDITK